MKIEALQTPYHTLAFTYDYKPEVVKYCQLIKGSWGIQSFSFNGAHKAWVFSDPKIVEAIVERFPQVEVSEQVKVLTHMKELELIAEEVKIRELTAVKISNNSDIKIPGFKGELYPFQKAGVEFLVKSGTPIRAILADDPGLGKTAQSIATMLASNQIYPMHVLVVCPATMKYTWQAEVKKWSDLTSIVIDTNTKIAEIEWGTHVWIINYDLLKKHLAELVKIKFDMMFLDEAHYIKTPNTIRSRAIRILAKNINDIVLLTGTPVLNRPAELFNPLSILDPKTWNNYYRFVDRYCDARHTRFGLDVSGSSNVEELSQKLDKVMLRRRKEDVLKELPEKIRIQVPLDLDKGSSKVYHKAYGNFVTFLKENKGKKPTEIAKALQAEKLVRLNSLREISGNGKVEGALEIIRNTIAGGEKIIVFSSFIAPLRDLHMALGNEAVLLTGQTPNEERFEIVKKFQEDPSTKVFLGGIKSAGVGITLTEASNVLFLDYSWTPADHKQAEDRAHRIGSKHASINIYQLHARGTIDDIMVKMLNSKREVVEKLVGEGDDQSSMSMVLEEIINSIK